MHNRIGTRDLIAVIWRSLLIQASWSYERMQSVGFAYALLPVLRRLYPDPDERRDRIQAHLEYFNTQPYLASFILGAAARLEEDRALKRGGSSDVSSVKSALAAPLGALGDSFFWAGLKPLAAAFAAALIVTGATWEAVVCYLALYNIVHLGMRADLVFFGYRTAGDAARLMRRYRLTRHARTFKSLSLAALGGMLGAAPIWAPEFSLPGALTGPLPAGMALGITVALLLMLRVVPSPVKMLLLLALGAVILALGGLI